MDLFCSHLQRIISKSSIIVMSSDVFAFCLYLCPTIKKINSLRHSIASFLLHYYCKQTTPIYNHTSAHTQIKIPTQKKTSFFATHFSRGSWPFYFVVRVFFLGNLVCTSWGNGIVSCKIDTFWPFWSFLNCFVFLMVLVYNEAIFFQNLTELLSARSENTTFRFGQI